MKDEITPLDMNDLCNDLIVCRDKLQGLLDLISIKNTICREQIQSAIWNIEGAIADSNN